MSRLYPTSIYAPIEQAPRVGPVREFNQKLLTILQKPGELTQEEWAYVAQCEREFEERRADG